MKWSELLALLKAYEEEGADLSGLVRYQTQDIDDPLDLVESATTGKLLLVTRWDNEVDNDE